MAERTFYSEDWEGTEIPTQLQDLLPNGYSYKLKKWNTCDNQPNHFEAVILVNVYTEDEAQEWWHEFNIKSNTTMRVRATCPKTGKVNTFKIYLRCLHQGRLEKPDKPEKQRKSKASRPVKRNTGCPAGMIIAIRRIIKYSRSKKRDPVDPIHPCEVQIRFVHNHPIDSADSLRFRPVSKEAEEKLLSLYQIGHSPASALETLKVDLQIEHGEDYPHIAADRYHCPDKSYCYRLYYKHFGKEYASSAKKDIGNTLNAKILQYNTELMEPCVSVCKSGNDFAVAVCTPLMKRAHTLQQAGDIVYVESSESPGNKERGEHHVFLFIAHTAGGGVPLGAVVTTSGNTQLISMGFQLLKHLLPELAFCGRGVAGPHVFLIEESESQRLALHLVWSESDIILCIFRILQSLWRWLWDDKHNIHRDHRLYLLYLVKTLLYASSEVEMADKYRALCEDSITVHYPQYLQQAECLWQRRHFWGICFHKLLPLQGANNYYEAAVRALKDKAFEQTKAFNIVQLVNFIVTRLEAYYKNKLLAVTHNRVNHILRCHYPNTIPPHVDTGIRQVAGNYYLVPSEQSDDKVNTVDAELNTCTCSTGITGAFCRHQYWVFLKAPTDMFMVSYMSTDFREKLYTIATGSTAPSGTLQTDAVPQADSTTQINCDPNPKSAVSEPVEVETNQVFEETNLPQVNSTESNFSDSPDIADTASNRSSPVPEEKNENMQLSEQACKRMTDVAEKFEDFCQRVKDGIKSRPQDFIPALEIMMKNLERKGNSSDSLISGLSFFGVIAGPSLNRSPKERKRPAHVVQPTEEIVPRVHGRQMVTYGKRRIVLNEQNSTAEESKSSSEISTTVATKISTVSVNSSCGQ